MQIYFINNQFGSGNVVISEDQQSKQACDTFQKQVEEFMNLMKKQAVTPDKTEPTNDLLKINEN